MVKDSNDNLKINSEIFVKLEQIIELARGFDKSHDETEKIRDTVNDLKSNLNNLINDCISRYFKHQRSNCDLCFQRLNEKIDELSRDIDEYSKEQEGKDDKTNKDFKEDLNTSENAIKELFQEKINSLNKELQKHLEDNKPLNWKHVGATALINGSIILILILISFILEKFFGIPIFKILQNLLT